MTEIRNLGLNPSREANRVMEADTISKNGRSLKSQMSRGNFLSKVCFTLLVACFGLCLTSCEKEYIVDITYHCEGSADLIAAYDFTVIYFSETGEKIQEMVQLPWQKTVKGFPLPVLNKMEWIGTPKQNYLQKDSYEIDIDAYVTYTGVKGAQPPRLPFHFTFKDTLAQIKGEYTYSIHM